MIRRTCDEKVESDCSRLCSSPMSARTSSKIGKLRTLAGRHVQARSGP